MKFRFHLNSKQLAYLFGVIILVGSIASGSVNDDKRWINWHFSRLGEGGTFSSVIFNISLVLSAIVVYFMGKEIVNSISKINDIPKTVQNRAKNIIGNIFILITVCLVVVSIFPFDRFPVIHNIFGYSMLFSALYMYLFMNNILPIFSKQFYMYGYTMVFVATIFYILYLGFSAVSLLFIEFVMYILFYYWLLQFINGISSIASQSFHVHQKLE